MTRRIDARWRALGVTLALVLAGGLALHSVRSLHEPAAPDPAAELRRQFDAAVVLLHARRYDDAAAALHTVLQRAPLVPEAHVNMGYALLGLQRPDVARRFFDGAIALAPMQANAYYGLALVHEAQGDVESARGAMRSYLHLAREERPEHLARARSALWEWERATSLPSSGKPFPGPASASPRAAR